MERNRHRIEAFDASLLRQTIAMSRVLGSSSSRVLRLSRSVSRSADSKMQLLPRWPLIPHTDCLTARLSPDMARDTKRGPGKPGPHLTTVLFTSPCEFPGWPLTAFGDSAARSWMAALRSAWHGPT